MSSVLVSVFLREQKRYTQKELSEKLHCPETHAVQIIRKLKEYGVLKAVSASANAQQRDLSELNEADVEVSDVETGENEYFYVFTFVGVIVIAGCVLKICPKYLLSNDAPAKELQQVIRVLEKYNSEEQILRMVNTSSESSSFNLLAVMLFLLTDYYENGAYSSTEEIIVHNGTGEILWDKTINETFTLISNNRPYYTDLITRKRTDNEFDWIRQLHECILTKVSEELRDTDLLDLFDLEETALSDGDISDFGETDYILYRLEQELNTQFNTRKQTVLKTVYAYIAHNGSFYDTDCLSLFGTNSFNLVWEKVCSEILNNKLKEPVCSLGLSLNKYDKYDGKLIDLIEKPMWTETGHTAQDTLIPDLISVTRDYFIIFDAKYYNVVLEDGRPPRGQPGIESVIKQYLYQLAFQKFITDCRISRVGNCFLLPTEEKEILKKGEVRLDMLAELGLQDIQVRFIPTSVAYDLYLSGKKMDIGKLDLW